VLAGALAFSVSPLVGISPASAADALPPLANPIADGAFCDGAPGTNPFTDLGAESADTRETILCLVATELTTGTTATTYTPGGTVTRRQMSLFIKRLADLFNELETGTPPLAALPAYDGSSDFSDVSASDPGAAAIGQLSQAGIVGGFSNGTFRPNDPVSRRQMAAFVNRLQDHLVGTPYSDGGKNYFDDDNGDSGEANLDALANVGIFQGDGAGHVFPGSSLTRRQMANILLRDAQVYFAFGSIDSPFVVTPVGNATLAITPTAPATLEFDSSEPPANTTDDRQYTVTGLTAGLDYTIQLFPAANLAGAPTYTFTENGVTNTADEGAVAADITVVNGAAVAAPDDDAVTQPVSGTITFTVDGDAAETIIPVIYRDVDVDGNLDLNADNTPIAAEVFGVGGSIRFLPAEAALGASAITVTSVTPERDAFVSGGVTYFLDSNDTFRYQGVGITMAQFDSILSVGDIGTANYNPDPAGVSVFDITTDVVTAPAAPVATVSNGDAGTTINDVRVTYTRPATNSPGVTYKLQRTSTALFGPDLVCGGGDDIVLVPFADVATATQAAGTGTGVFVFSDNNPADGCYYYRVVATSPISNTAANSASSGAALVPTPADAVAPQSIFTARTTDTSSLDLDGTDVIKIVFNEPMAAPTAATKITLTDGNGTIAELSSANATFTLNAATESVTGAPGNPQAIGTVLTITLTAAPTITAPGTTPGVQLPANVTNRVAITDTSGNGWNLVGGDITVN
jgi:hypothetical protein